MEALQRFISELKIIRDKHFKEMISEYKNKYTGTNYWNGEELKIDNIIDMFIYLSEDKKSIEITNSNFIESMKFSYLLYFSRYHHVAKYTNGGLDFLGFFNEKYEKIDKINIHNFDIVECIGTCNFDGLRKPTFNFNLIHEYGNKHSSLRGDILVPRTCQKALDSVWELEEFYISFYERIIESPPSASGYK